MRLPSRIATYKLAVPAGLILLQALLVICSCNRHAKETTPEPGGTLRVAVLEPIDVPSPLYAMHATSAWLAEHVIPPLGRMDERNVMHYLLARDCFDRGAYMDFKLRPARWEDGTPVVPRDIVRTAELLRDPRVHSPDRPRTDLLRACRTLNDSTVRLEYQTIYARRRRDALLAPLPSHRSPWPAGADTLREQPYLGPPLACGPFRVAALHANSITLVRNDISGLPPARLDSVFVGSYEPADAARDFKAGSLDAVVDLPPHLVLDARRRRGARAIGLVGRSYIFMGWNLRDGRFADPAVRRAAAMAVDTARLIRELTFGVGDPSRGPLTALAGFADTTRMLPHDVAAAKRALDSAGWIDPNGDGVRERRGARLEFHVLAPREDELRVAAARAVARDLRRIGMRVEVRDLSNAELLQRLQSRSFETFMGQWFPDPDGGLDAVWRSDATSELNFCGYANPVTDSLLTMLSHEMDPESRELVLSRFQACVYADQPCLFLFQNPHFLLLAPRVRGAEPNVVSAFWNLPEWWIPSRARPR